MKSIKRICEMEAILDKANYLMDIKSDELEDFRPEIERLEAYYTSRKWKYDYAFKGSTVGTCYGRNWWN